jgi:hypothetical protein
MISLGFSMWMGGRPTVATNAAEAAIVTACAPDILLVAGTRGTAYLTGDPITAWDDVTANNRDGSSADGPTVYTASGETYADFENTADSGGQQIVVPHLWLSAATKFSLAMVVQRTKLAQTGVLFSFDSFDVAARFQADNSLRFYPTASTPYAGCAFGADACLLEMDFDGTFTDADPAVQNAGRFKVSIDGTEQSLTFSGNIGSATPTLSLGGSLGRQSNNAAAAQCRIGLFLGKAGAVLDATAKTALRANVATLFPSL